MSGAAAGLVTEAAGTQVGLRGRLADAMAAPGWQDQTVARPDGESGTASVHAGWRLALAERAARAYASNEKLAALTVAGSVGTGLADRFSDLELDCYWFDPPGDLDRSGPGHVLGGELEALWDYDHDEEEWSDDYRLADLEVTVRASWSARSTASSTTSCCARSPIRSSTCVWPRCTVLARCTGRS